MIFEKHANLKFKYENRLFWRRRYYVDTGGKNTTAIKAYDPFTGEFPLGAAVNVVQPAELQCAFWTQAGNSPYKRLCKPPARPVVLTKDIARQFTDRAFTQAARFPDQRA